MMLTYDTRVARKYAQVYKKLKKGSRGMVGYR